MMLINPIPMPMDAWCDMSTLALSKFGNIPRLEGKQWKRWALNVVQLSSIAKFNVPSPLAFDDWREWAIRFNEALNS